jgi:hypothetical protein
VTVTAIRRRNVQVHRPRRRASGIPNLVTVAALDEHQRAGTERVTPSVDRRDAATGNGEQPLVGGAIAVLRVFESPSASPGEITISAACARRLASVEESPEGPLAAQRPASVAAQS